MPSPAATPNPWLDRWQRFSAAALRAFHAYASWLVSISWKRFIVLAVLLMITAAILQSLPPFRWSVTETIEDAPLVKTPKPPKPPKPAAPAAKAEAPKPAASGAEGVDINIQIDESGIRITPRQKGAAARPPADGASAADESISITLPPGIDKESVREAVQEARDAIREAVREKRREAEIAREIAAAEREAAQAAREADEVALPGPTGKVRRVRNVHWGDFLTDLALLWIIASAIVKATYKGRIQAEVKAAQATETAEAESLKRQVVEARMAAMQAQV